MFIANDFWAKRSKLKFTDFKNDQVELVIMALGKEHDDDINSCLTSVEMLDLAAKYGIAYDRERVYDSSSLSRDFDKFWADIELETGNAEAIRQEVGEKVFDISGMTPVLEEMKEKERVKALKEQGNVNGDGETPDVYIDRLNDDEAA